MPNSKTQSKIDYVSNFFKNFEQKIAKIELNYNNENSYLDKIFARLDVGRREVLISDCLNEKRRKLIKRALSSFLSRVPLITISHKLKTTFSIKFQISFGVYWSLNMRAHMS